MTGGERPSSRSKRICPQGHVYYKSSSCPVCPECERERAPSEGFLSRLPAPARRALENAGIRTPQALAKHAENEVLALHGLGKASLPVLREALREAGLRFRS